MINSATWYRHAFINRLQTFLLLISMAGFLAFLGWLLWGSEGLIIMLIVAIILLMVNPVFSPQFIMKLYRAERLTQYRFPELYFILAELVKRSGLKAIPDLYYVPSGIINAFTVGRPGQAVIGITDGLIRSLDTREIAGVFAHEISHIRSNDMLVMSLADMFTRMTSSFSLIGQIFLFINLPLIFLGVVNISWLLIIILLLAPVISTLAQLGLSRTREYDADLNAARLTGDPEGLASALVKIEKVQGGWIERLILPGRGVPEPSILRTHPPTEERVRRLLTFNLDQNGHSPFHHSIMTPFDQNFSTSRVKRKPGWHITGLWH